MTIKLLAVDFGLTKVGLAYYDGFLVEPIGVLRGKNEGQLLKKLIDLAGQLGVQKIIFGLPESGPFLVAAQAFAAKLKAATDLVVEESREVLTTKEALARMKEAGVKRRQRVAKEDAVAAAILLEDYLAGLKNV